MYRLSNFTNEVESEAEETKPWFHSLFHKQSTMHDENSIIKTEDIHGKQYAIKPESVLCIQPDLTSPSTICMKASDIKSPEYLYWPHLIRVAGKNCELHCQLNLSEIISSIGNEGFFSHYEKATNEDDKKKLENAYSVQWNVFIYENILKKLAYKGSVVDNSILWERIKTAVLSAEELEYDPFTKTGRDELIKFIDEKLQWTNSIFSAARLSLQAWSSGYKSSLLNTAMVNTILAAILGKGLNLITSSNNGYFIFLIKWAFDLLIRLGIVNSFFELLRNKKAMTMLARLVETKLNFTPNAIKHEEKTVRSIVTDLTQLQTVVQEIKEETKIVTKEIPNPPIKEQEEEEEETEKEGTEEEETEMDVKSPTKNKGGFRKKLQKYHAKKVSTSFNTSKYLHGKLSGIYLRLGKVVKARKSRSANIVNKIKDVQSKLTIVKEKIKKEEKILKSLSIKKAGDIAEFEKEKKINEIELQSIKNKLEEKLNEEHQIENRKQEIETQIHNMKQQLNEIVENMNEHKLKLEETKTNIGVNEDVNKVVQSMKEEKSQLQKSNKESQSKIQKLTEEISLKTETLSKLEEELETEKNELSIVQKELEKTKNEYKTAFKELKEKTDELKELGDESRRDKEKLQIIINENSQSISFLKEVNTKIKEETKNLETIRNQLQSKNVQMESKISEKDKHIQSIESDLNQLKSELTNKKDEIETLKRLTSQSTDKDKELAKLQNNLNSKNSELIELQKQLTIEKQALNELQKQSKLDKDTNRNQLESKEKQLIQLQNEIQTNKDEIKQLKLKENELAIQLREENQKNRNEIEQLKLKESELFQLKKQFEADKKFIEQLKSEKSGSIELNKANESQIKQLNILLKEKENEIENLKSTKNELTNTIKLNNENKNELEEKIKNLTTKYNEKEIEVNHLNKELVDAKQKNSKWSEENTRLIKRINSDLVPKTKEMKTKIDQLKEENTKLQEDITQLREEINQKDNHIANLSVNYNEIIASKQRDIDVVLDINWKEMTNFKTLQRQYDEKLREIEQLKNTNKTIRQQLNTSKKNISSLQSQLNEKVNEATKVISSLEEEKSGIKSVTHLLSYENEYKNKEIEQLQLELDEQKLLVEKLEEELKEEKSKVFVPELPSVTYMKKSLTNYYDTKYSLPYLIDSNLKIVEMQGGTSFFLYTSLPIKFTEKDRNSPFLLHGDIYLNEDFKTYDRYGNSITYSKSISEDWKIMKIYNVKKIAPPIFGAATREERKIIYTLNLEYDVDGEFGIKNRMIIKDINPKNFIEGSHSYSK